MCPRPVWSLNALKSANNIYGIFFHWDTGFCMHLIYPAKTNFFSHDFSILGKVSKKTRTYPGPRTHREAIARI